MPRIRQGNVVAHGDDYFSDAGYPITAKRVKSTGTTTSHPHDLTEIEHEHDFCELVVVLGGMARHCLEGDHFPVAAGDVFLLQGRQRHYFYQRERLDLINVMYDPRRLNLPENNLRKLPGYCAMFLLEPAFRGQHRFASRLHLDSVQLARVEQLAGEIARETGTRLPGYEITLTSRLLDLIILLSRNYLGCETTEARALMRMGRVIGSLECEYHRTWTLEQLYRLAHMSRSHFMRVFRRATGQAPMAYLTNLRIRKAMDLLRSTDLSITEIAMNVGYNDSNYFTRQFKKVTQSTPGVFRKG